MRALAMSVMSLARTAASRVDGRARAYVASAVSLVRIAASRADGRARPYAASAVSMVRTAASRCKDLARAFAASAGNFGRAAAARTEGPAAACAASIVRLGRAVAAHTEGVRTQAAVAFTLSFVLAMIVGLMVFPPGARIHRAAPTLAPEPSAGPPVVAPSVDPLAALPPVALPRLADPSRRAEGAVPLPNAVPVDRPQAASAAVRTSAGVRTEIARVTGIALWGNPSKPWVSITASAPVRYQLRNVEADWVVIDVSRAELALAPGTLPAGRGLVRLIRVGQFTPDVVRVVLELAEAVPIHVATSPGRNAIVVSLAVDAKGNGHNAPGPNQRPGAAQPMPLARSGSRVSGT